MRQYREHWPLNRDLFLQRLADAFVRGGPERSPAAYLYQIKYQSYHVSDCHHTQIHCTDKYKASEQRRRTYTNHLSQKAIWWSTFHSQRSYWTHTLAVINVVVRRASVCGLGRQDLLFVCLWFVQFSRKFYRHCFSIKLVGLIYLVSRRSAAWAG